MYDPLFLLEPSRNSGILPSNGVRHPSRLGASRAQRVGWCSSRVGLGTIPVLAPWHRQGRCAPVDLCRGSGRCVGRLLTHHCVNPITCWLYIEFLKRSLDTLARSEIGWKTRHAL